MSHSAQNMTYSITPVRQFEKYRNENPKHEAIYVALNEIEHQILIQEDFITVILEHIIITINENLATAKPTDKEPIEALNAFFERLKSKDKKIEKVKSLLTEASNILRELEVDITEKKRTLG